MSEVSLYVQSFDPARVRGHFPVEWPLSRRAKRERLPRVERLSPESQGQNLAMTVLCVPESGRDLLI